MNKIVLSHGDCVRLPRWRMDYARVCTLNGYCSPSNAELARSNGHPDAWTVFSGQIIVNDIGYYNERKRRVEQAHVLQDGMIVIIEDREFRVRVVLGNAGKSPRDSAPIAFDPIESVVIASLDDARSAAARECHAIQCRASNRAAR